jgi:hypothetical protein
MPRPLRILTVASMLAIVPSVAWAMRRRWTRPSAMPDDTRPLGYGDASRRMMYRAGRILRGDFGRVDEAEGNDGGPVPFDWAFGTTDAGVIGTALASEGISVDTTGTAPEERDLVVADKLMSAGIHLDQEPSPAFAAVPRSRYVGEAKPTHLMRAVERALDTTHSGVIVDTTRGSTVEIDQHRDVGKGNVVLIDPSGSRVLRHGTTRLLLQALREAADTNGHQRGSGAPDIPRSTSMA